MGPGLGRLEYWLLDVVAEFAVPLHLLRKGEIEIALNRPSLGASDAELARGLVALRDLRLVTLEFEGDVDRHVDVTELERFISAPARVDCMRLSESVSWVRMDHDESVRCGLTAAGGAEWERAAKPEWTRYVEYRTWPEGDGWEHTVICADAARAEQYLAFQRCVWHKPGGLSEESIVRDVIRPWQATYWKDLPEAYIIRFRTAADAQRYPPHDEAARWDDRWHADPWETAAL